MPPNPKIIKAYKAMRAIGITEARVKPVLKRLVKVYDKNWEFIEDEEYRALVDAIFEEEAAQGSRAVAGAGEVANYGNEVEDEHERPLKRLRRGLPGQSSSPFHNTSSGLIGLPSIKPEVEENFGTYCTLQSPDTRRSGSLVGLPRNYAATQSHVVDRSLAPYSLSPQQRYAYKGKQPLVPQVAPRETAGPVPFMALVPKNEPLTDDIPQHHLHHSVLPLEISGSEDWSVRIESMGRQDGLQSSASSENRATCEASAANLEIATMGGVKIYVSCNSMLGRPTFHMPRQQELLKLVEEKCLPSYPNFSVRKVLKVICGCFLELAADSTAAK